jgi:UTP:GlnB (protein PII) uridylyltransferase
MVDKIPKHITIASGRRPEPNQVRIDNDTSSFFTIIEVLTYDFAGLLFTITNALYRSGANVNVAMVGARWIRSWIFSTSGTWKMIRKSRTLQNSNKLKQPS